MIAVLLGVFVSQHSWGAEHSLTLSEDTWINGRVPNAIYGEVDSLHTHNWQPKYSLLRFDTSSISGQTVARATLKLFVRDVRNSGSVTLHTILTPWDEDNTSWNTRPSFKTSESASFQVGVGDTGNIIEIDVTNVVQSWASGDQENWGLLTSTLSNILLLLDSKENSAGVPATIDVSTGPSAETVMNLESIPYIIDAPGLYTLDRNWDLEVDNDEQFSFIRINSDKVIVDMRGYRLRMSGTVPVTGLDINASGVLIHNGSINISHTISCDGSAIAGMGNDIRVLDMLIFGHSECPGIGGVRLSGIEHRVIRVNTAHSLCDPMLEDCKIDRGGSIQVGDHALVKDNNLFCENSDCLVVGSNSSVINNHVSQSILVGSGNLVVNNVAAEIEATGTGNVIENNW